MIVNLLTDAPKHNLALMKISAYHKSVGDQVYLNFPLMPCDLTYASVLFEENRYRFNADRTGGIGCTFGDELDGKYQNSKPDYSLYNLNYSLGYTFRPCFRKCKFCKVWKTLNRDVEHHSIYEFHNPKFKKICLLNNNTFFDKQWRETFEEIWEANLTVIEHGFDLRLLDDEKCEALKRTKFEKQIHFAWDRMGDETEILRGLELLKKHKVSGMVYVLIGYDTTEADDIYRCQKITDLGFDPYIMPYKQTKRNMAFKRMFGLFMWRKYKTIKEAWSNYQ